MKEVKVKLLAAGGYESLNMIELPVVVDGYTKDEGDELAFVRASTLKKIVNTAYGSDYPFFIGSECEIVNQTETTSKQVDSLANNSELPNSSEWNSGDECRYNDINWLFCGFHPVNGLAIVSNNDNPHSHQLITVDVKLLSKPESPEQKAERDRLEAIEAMCDEVDKLPHGEAFAAMATLYDLGYRKAK